ESRRPTRRHRARRAGQLLPPCPHRGRRPAVGRRGPPARHPHHGRAPTAGRLSPGASGSRGRALGVKGVGEAGATAAPPAAVNAIVDALRPYGVSDVPMPCTPERVWAAIQEAAGNPGEAIRTPRRGADGSAPPARSTPAARL